MLDWGSDFTLASWSEVFPSSQVDLVKAIIWVFGLQCASAAWECCVGFMSKQ